MASSDGGGRPPSRMARATNRTSLWLIRALALTVPIGFCWGLVHVGRTWPTVFVGAVLMIACYWLTVSVLTQLRLRLRGRPAEGVVEHVRSRMVGTGNVGAKLRHTATVRFETPDGVRWAYGVPARSETRPGQPYPLHYDPRKHSRATELHPVGQLLAEFLLFLVFIGLTSWFLVWVATGGRFP